MVQPAPHESLQDAIDRITALRARIASDARAVERAELPIALDDVRDMLVKLQEHCGRLDEVLDQRDFDLERLRTTTARTALREERSRHSLASELQSGLGQYLALAKYRLAALRGTSDTALREALAQIEALVDQADRSLRTVTLQISPPSLYDLGLVSALEWLAEEMKSRFDLTVDIVDDQTPNIDDEGLRVLVYRCVRELLLNVAGHADVRLASVRLALDGDDLKVRVVDQGRGFDVEAFERKGHGLFELREQLRPLGGTLVVTSSASGGTSALVSVPLTLGPRPQQRSALRGV